MRPAWANAIVNMLRFKFPGEALDRKKDTTTPKQLFCRRGYPRQVAGHFFDLQPNPLYSFLTHFLWDQFYPITVYQPDIA